VSEEPRKLLCCIVPRGKGLPLLEALGRDRGLHAGHVHTARGLGRATPLGRRAAGEAAERDLLTVVVPASQADDVFEFLYFEGGLDRPHGGFLYQRALTQASEYTLPPLDAPGPAGADDEGQGSRSV
jgi:hypothetical protein